MKITTTIGKGFTLIEVVVYIGLLSIFMTGVFMSLYPLFDAATWLRDKNNGIEESHVALSTLYTLIKNADSVDILENGAGEGVAVSVSIILRYDAVWGNEIKIYEEDNQLRLIKDTGEYVYITSHNVAVRDTTFTYVSEEFLGQVFVGIFFSFLVNSVLYSKTIWLP